MHPFQPPQRPSQPPPAPQAPARPGQTLPPDYDLVNVRRYADEFDAIPLPDQAESKARALVCDETNMKYIKSRLPMPPDLQFAAFFQQMAKRQWQAPFVRRDGERRHITNGSLPLGAHRDLGANPMMTDRTRPIHGHATSAEDQKE